MTQLRVVVVRRVVFLAAIAYVVVAHGRREGEVTPGDGVLNIETVGVDLAPGHEVGLVVAVVVLLDVVDAARHPHVHITLVLAELHAGGHCMVQRAAGKQADVLDLEHVVGVAGFHLAPAAGGLGEGLGVTLVGLFGVGVRVLDLQIHQRIVQGFVFVFGRPGGVDRRAVGQVAPRCYVVAILVDVGLAGWRGVTDGREGHPQIVVRARVRHAHAVFVIEVQIELEQLSVQVLGGIGQALGVNRVDIAGVGHFARQLHIVAVALGVVKQGVGAAIFGATVDSAAVDLLMVIAAVAVLEHGAGVLALFEQVGRILGFHVHYTGEAAIAGVDIVGAFFDFQTFDQLGFDKNRALLVAFKAAFGRAIDGHLYVFSFTHAPDIDGLATGLERAAEVDARQGGEQAGDVIGLIAVDLLLGHGRLADVAGVDFATVAHHADRAQFQAVAGGGAGLPGPHDVGAIDLH